MTYGMSKREFIYESRIKNRLFDVDTPGPVEKLPKAAKVKRPQTANDVCRMMRDYDAQVKKLTEYYQLIERHKKEILDFTGKPTKDADQNWDSRNYNTLMKDSLIMAKLINNVFSKRQPSRLHGKNTTKSVGKGGSQQF